MRTVALGAGVFLLGVASAVAALLYYWKREFDRQTKEPEE